MSPYLAALCAMLARTQFVRGRKKNTWSLPRKQATIATAARRQTRSARRIGNVKKAIPAMQTDTVRCQNTL